MTSSSALVLGGSGGIGAAVVHGLAADQAVAFGHASRWERARALATELEGELGPRFTPPDLLVRLVEQGHLGRKTGRGFYDWGSE